MHRSVNSTWIILVLYFTEQSVPTRTADNVVNNCFSCAVLKDMTKLKCKASRLKDSQNLVRDVQDNVNSGKTFSWFKIRALADAVSRNGSSTQQPDTIRLTQNSSEDHLKVVRTGTMQYAPTPAFFFCWWRQRSVWEPLCGFAWSAVSAGVASRDRPRSARPGTPTRRRRHFARPSVVRALTLCYLLTFYC